jgi:hypothetical protein
VAELADAADSKSAGALLCVGSTPSSGTIPLGTDLLINSTDGLINIDGGCLFVQRSRMRGLQKKTRKRLNRFNIGRRAPRF